MPSQAVTDKLKQLFQSGTNVSYKRGEIIVSAYQAPRGVMLLGSGAVEQYDLNPAGDKVVVNIFKPPAFFPMAWAINQTENEYYYAALTDVTMKRISAAKAVSFLKANPDVMFDLLSRVYQGTDGVLRRLVLALGGSASNRLIFELLVEAYRFGIEIGGGKWRIKVTQGSLAARSGLARETVSREFSKLLVDKLVERAGRDAIIEVASLELRLGINS